MSLLILNVIVQKELSRLTKIERWTLVRHYRAQFLPLNFWHRNPTHILVLAEDWRAVTQSPCVLMIAL